MKPIRVVVTGSRDWKDPRPVDVALDLIAAAARKSASPLIVAHGCAPGADEFADRWVRRRSAQGWPVEVERHPANWEKHKRRAGVIRNKAMLKPGADAVLAFINPCADTKCRKSTPHGSHGASHCADLAESEGIPTQRIERFVTHEASYADAPEVDQ